MLLEPVQHFHLSFYDWLVVLNLPSLQYRRQRMDMIMMYMILNDLEGLPFDDLFSKLLEDQMVTI